MVTFASRAMFKNEDAMIDAGVKRWFGFMWASWSLRVIVFLWWLRNSCELAQQLPPFCSSTQNSQWSPQFGRGRLRLNRKGRKLNRKGRSSHINDDDVWYAWRSW